MRSIRRRQILQGGLVAAATLGLIRADSRLDRTPEVGGVAAGGASEVFWDPVKKIWPPRPGRGAAGVIFYSTTDAQAPTPGDFNVTLGDVWWRHPTSEYLIQPVLPR